MSLAEIHDTQLTPTPGFVAGVAVTTIVLRAPVTATVVAEVQAPTPVRVPLIAVVVARSGFAALTAVEIARVAKSVVATFVVLSNAVGVGAFKAPSPERSKVLPAL